MEHRKQDNLHISFGTSVYMHQKASRLFPPPFGLDSSPYENYTGRKTSNQSLTHSDF